jgi:hypothetical protein
MALKDTRDGRYLLSLCENFGAGLARLRAEMAEAGDAALVPGGEAETTEADQ